MLLGSPLQKISRLRRPSQTARSIRQDIGIARLLRSQQSSTRDANHLTEGKSTPESHSSQDSIPASIPATSARLRIKPNSPSMDQLVSSRSSGLSKRPATDEALVPRKRSERRACTGCRHCDNWRDSRVRRQNRAVATKGLSEALPDRMTHSHGKKRPEGESRSSDGDKSDSFADSDYQLVPQDSLYLRRKNRWSGFVLLPLFFFPMSQEQLVAGVKVIYDALMIVEAICNTQTASQSKGKLEAFFELHRKLTYGHDDFLEVTQDSSADPTLRALAAKSLMLAQSVNLLYVHYGLIVTQQRSPTHLASIMQRIRFLTGNSRSASSESPTRSTTEPTISGSLQGINISAFPDTGANANFISERYAKHYGFPIDNSAKSHATVGNGASVSIIGTTTLSFHFAKESTTHLLTFNVLRESIHDVILGSPFLRVTETLTRFTARIGQKIRDSVDDNFFKMCLLGSSNMYVRGLVNGTPVSAVPDTGAEVSVMSASFARENGFHVNSDERHRVPFGFADGSTAEALGVIRDATWNYGRDKKAHLTNFYVLEDLPVDVVLGNDFLCRTNAFVEHEDDFWHVETATSKDGFALNLIRVLEPCADAQPSDHTGTNASANTNLEGRRAEALAAYRRAKQEAQDQNLTGDEKTRYLEPFLTTWQRLWEINPGLATPAGSATSVSPSNNISTSSSQVNGTQNHNGLQQQAPDPGIDSSSPLSKSRVNWLKRAVGWRSRRCVVAV